MDPIRESFEKFKKDGLARIKKAVAEEWQEGPQLDFKTLEKNSAPMTRSDKKTLAGALSGSANSDGGIIIWGVDARSDGSDDPDAAKKEQPIAELELFLSDLQRLAPQVVSPAIIGVEHRAIECSPSSDRGYMVTLVPKSQGQPHMARAAEQHTFYFRSGSSFLPMEPFMLADRYSRRPQPKLEFEWRIESRGTTDSPHLQLLLRVIVGIGNSGAGIALYPAIAIYKDPRFRINPYGYRTGLAEVTAFSGQGRKRPRMFSGGSDRVVYPGSTLEATNLLCTLDPALEVAPDLAIEYELYCDGYSHADTIAIPVDEEFQKMKANLLK